MMNLLDIEYNGIGQYSSYLGLLKKVNELVSTKKHDYKRDIYFISRSTYKKLPILGPFLWYINVQNRDATLFM